MWEYLNMGLVILIVLIGIPLTVISFIGSKNERWKLVFIPMLVFFIYLQMHNSYTNAIENIKLYHKDKPLICFNGSNKYRVSKQASWKLDKNYFYNDLFTIRADNCKPVK